MGNSEVRATLRGGLQIELQPAGIPHYGNEQTEYKESNGLQGSSSFSPCFDKDYLNITLCPHTHIHTLRKNDIIQDKICHMQS